MYGAGASAPAPEHLPFFASSEGATRSMCHVLGVLHIWVVDVVIRKAIPVPVDQIFHNILIGTYATALA